jgi:hypothetical protein
MEPLLGAVDLTALMNDKLCSQGTGYVNCLQGFCFDADSTGYYDIGDKVERVDWVIVGGESGPNARPMHPGWARSICDQCQAAGVPFFFKQWGEWGIAGEWYDTVHCELVNKRDGRRLPVVGGWGRWDDSSDYAEMQQDRSKHAAGRLLDGREWSEHPQEVTP